LLPGRIIEVERAFKLQIYLQQILGLVAEWSVAHDLSDSEVIDDLSEILSATLDGHLRDSWSDFEEARFKAMRKFRFLERNESTRA